MVSPYPAVSFANELTERRNVEPTGFSFQQEAEAVVDVAAGVFDGWGPV